MNTGGRLIAGSHNRNEFVLINADENARVCFSSSFVSNSLSFDLCFSISVQKSLTFFTFLVDLALTTANQLRFRVFSTSIKITYPCS